MENLILVDGKGANELHLDGRWDVRIDSQSALAFPAWASTETF